ncbi:MAG: hypothetical protein ISR42_07885, partial [Acidimicrobiia bacterium]|nr:hypothetical protein [Acidimicrobiia bacterium]
MPDLSEVERLAKHDLMWSGTWDLGLRWDNSDEQPYRGMAVTLADVDGDDEFTAAIAMKEDLLGINPNLRTLVEIRYRDGRFVGDEAGLPWWDLGHYPPDSPYWIRDAD